MITRFQEFDLINENMTKARAVLRQSGKTQTDPEFVKLRNLLANNLGYIGKFTEWMYVNKVEYKQLEALFNRIKDVRLSKPIDQFNTPEEVIDTLIRSNTETDLNQMLSAIPSNTRRMIKSCDDFSDLENFLTQHSDKKAAIIDFFSKKSGRYGEYDEEEVIENIIQDLEQIVDAKSIAEISELSKKSNHVKFVYEDDNKLVVAVDYEGIQEVGSRYWCITEDEYTFNDYILEADRPNIQLAIYFKDKIPFVDEQSVLGVTWNLQSNMIYAAHWEDDSEYNKQRSNDPIINLLTPLSTKMFQIAKSLYDWSSANWFWSVKSLYQEELNGAKAEFEKTGKTKSFEKIIDGYINWCQENDRVEDCYEQPFMQDFVDLIKSLNAKLDLSLEDIIVYRLQDIAKFNKDFHRENIFAIIDNYDSYIWKDEDIKKVLDFMTSNGYDLWSHVENVTEASQVIELGYVKPEKFFDKFGWEELNDDLDQAEVIIKWSIDNRLDDLVKAIILRKNNRFELGDIVIDIIAREPLKYKSSVLQLLSDKDAKERFKKSHMLDILKLGDNDLRNAVAYYFIPKEIYDYFDVQITPKAKPAKLEPVAKKKKK